MSAKLSHSKLGNMNTPQPNNPLHGITLKTILHHLVETLGWNIMGEEVNIRCFTDDPSISSSLKFLRKTPWARKRVEELYLKNFTAVQNSANLS